MRITTIDELESYLRTEAARIQAELAALAETDGDDATSLVRSVYLDGELAAVQKTLVMMTDDAFAYSQRRRAQSAPIPDGGVAALEAAWPADARGLDVAEQGP